MEVSYLHRDSCGYLGLFDKATQGCPYKKIPSGLPKGIFIIQEYSPLNIYRSVHFKVFVLQVDNFGSFLVVG